MFFKPLNQKVSFTYREVTLEIHPSSYVHAIIVLKAH